MAPNPLNYATLWVVMLFTGLISLHMNGAVMDVQFNDNIIQCCWGMDSCDSNLPVTNCRSGTHFA
jgi:hypothetical protein